MPLLGENTLRVIFTSLTTWLLLIFAVLIILQVIPFTGIFLMFVGAPIWVGYMPHLIALALFFDLLIKKAPKSLLLIPLLPYFSYYAYYAIEKVEISRIEQNISSQNPSEIFPYDPSVHSLITESNMTAYYKIPVSYNRNHNFPEGYLSHR